MLNSAFFHQEPTELAQALIGKVLRHRYRLPGKVQGEVQEEVQAEVQGENQGGKPVWLSAQIIETEAYYRSEKGSHSSLGFTEKRAAMFMDPGTIYMYYARGGDSLNFSALGDGNGVLIKAGIPHIDGASDPVPTGDAITLMHTLNPVNGRRRDTMKLCSGQTLFCKSLGLKVPDWNQKQLDKNKLVLEDIGYRPAGIVQCRRLGIPLGRDEHLPYRFVDRKHASYATKNPISGRSSYKIILSGEISDGR
jgi:DNA-3-methyladenine glycosylase